MQRRQFIAGFGSAVAWPKMGLAEQAVIPTIGFLANATEAGYRPYVTAFRQGLTENGLVEGRNVAIEFSWGDFDEAKLAELAAGLVRRKVAAMLVGSGEGAAYVAKSATSSIPIIVAMGGDPVSSGLVESLNRPGGNLTGVSYITVELMSKRLSLLRELAPQAKTVGYLTRPPESSQTTNAMMLDMVGAARALGLEVVVAEVRREQDFESAFAMLIGRRANALVVAPSPLTTTNRDRLVGLAAHHRIPAIYALREFVADGGLMSYGASIADAYRRTGWYVARILRGDKPGDLPIERSTRLEFALNLNTAKALGLTIPETLLATADEVLQ